MAEPQTRVAQILWRSETFKVGDQSFAVLRFPEGRGQTLAQAIAIAKGMEGREMLTLDEARKIKDNSESNSAFRKVLKPGDWTYLRDPEPEKMGMTAYLLTGSSGGLVTVGHYGFDNNPSPVLVLKETGSGKPVIERELRDMQFQEFQIQGGRTLHAVRGQLNVGINYDATKKALEAKGLELVAHQILIPGMDQNQDLKEFSKGYWGYVAGHGPVDESVVGSRTWNPKTGELKGLESETDKEKIVRVWQGPCPLALFVRSDYVASLDGSRFGIVADVWPNYAATMVWGIKSQTQAEPTQPAYGGKTAVEYALVSGTREIREILAHHIEEEAGGLTAVSIALRSDNPELRTLISEALRNRRDA